jgi:hypothetical protein
LTSSRAASLITRTVGSDLESTRSGVLPREERQARFKNDKTRRTPTSAVFQTKYCRFSYVTCSLLTIYLGSHSYVTGILALFPTNTHCAFLYVLSTQIIEGLTQTLSKQSKESLYRLDQYHRHSVGGGRLPNGSSGLYNCATEFDICPAASPLFTVAISNQSLVSKAWCPLAGFLARRSDTTGFPLPLPNIL